MRVSLTRHAVKPWISAISLRILDTCQSNPFGSEHNKARLISRSELNASLFIDCEIFWFGRAFTMEHAAGKKALDVKLTSCTPGGEV